jgi:hypothetical protein
MYGSRFGQRVVYSGHWNPFVLQVSTMTGKRALFQGFRGTPVDECPWRDIRCP